jgi:cytochrome c biogenesis protein CcmG, thiol:disulfide interchange protein DsbE
VVLVAVAIVALLGLSLFCFHVGESDRGGLSGDDPAGSHRPRRYEQHRAVGKRLSALSLEPLTGGVQPVTLEALAGKVVVVNFWGTWCGPCRQEFPELAELYESLHANPGFRFLSVSCGNGAKEDLAALRSATESFLESSGYQMPTYADPEEVTRTAYDRVASMEGYPATFVLDRDGLIRGVWPGSMPNIGKQIEDLVRRLLEPAGPDTPKSN